MFHLETIFKVEFSFSIYFKPIQSTGFLQEGECWVCYFCLLLVVSLHLFLPSIHCAVEGNKKSKRKGGMCFMWLALIVPGTAFLRS